MSYAITLIRYGGISITPLPVERTAIMSRQPSEPLSQKAGCRRPTPLRPKKGDYFIHGLPGIPGFDVDNGPAAQLFQKARDFFGGNDAAESRLSHSIMEDRGSLSHLTVGGSLH